MALGGVGERQRHLGQRNVRGSPRLRDDPVPRGRRLGTKPARTSGGLPAARRAEHWDNATLSRPSGWVDEVTEMLDLPVATKEDRRVGLVERLQPREMAIAKSSTLRFVRVPEPATPSARGQGSAPCWRRPRPVGQRSTRAVGDPSTNKDSNGFLSHRASATSTKHHREAFDSGVVINTSASLASMCVNNCSRQAWPGNTPSVASKSRKTDS